MITQSTTSIHKIGLTAAIILVISNMMGSGVFMLPATLSHIGGISIFGWIVTLIGVMMLAITLAKLSLLQPHGAGPCYYAQQAFGDFIGYQLNWIYIIANCVALVSLLSIISGYLSFFFIICKNTYFNMVIQLVIIWIMTLVNIKGAKVVSIIQSTSFLIALLPLILIISIGWHWFEFSIFQNGWNPKHLSNVGAVTKSFNNIMWSFIGVESACVSIAIIKKPVKNVPLATVIGVVIAAIIYILVCVVIMGVIPNAQLINSSAPFNDTLEIMFHSTSLNITMTIITIFACLGATAGWMLLIGQSSKSAAEHQLFPKLFAKNNNGVPRSGLIMLSIIYSLVVIFSVSPNSQDQFNQIITVSVILYLIPYIYSSIAIIKLGKQKMPQFAYIVHILFGIIAAIFCASSIYFSNSLLSLYVLILMFVISTFYMFKPKNII